MVDGWEEELKQLCGWMVDGWEEEGVRAAQCFGRHFSKGEAGNYRTKIIFGGILSGRVLFCCHHLLFTWDAFHGNPSGWKEQTYLGQKI